MELAVRGGLQALAGMVALILIALREGDPLPLPIAAIFVGAPMVVIGGVLLALGQRLREIGKGEVDDAKHY